MQIAGPDYSYPLTTGQLQKYLDDEKSCSFNVVDLDNNVIGHSEIILQENDLCKIDKLIIGEKSNRGKGIGLKVIDELLRFSFEKLGARQVELNVYDWNIAGIKCYQKAGFTFNPDKKVTTEINGEFWTALNMIIDKDRWLSKSEIRKEI